LNGTFVVADSANNVIHVNIAIGDIVFEQEDGDATISVAINNCQSTDGPTDGILSLTTEQNYNTVYRFAASTPLAGPVTIVFGSGHEDVWWNGFGPFLVENNTTQDIVAASNTPSGSPITVPAGEQRWFYFQGTGLQSTTLHQIPVASVAGTDTQLQFNQGGALGASASLAFDYTNDTLIVGVGTAEAFSSSLQIANNFSADTPNQWAGILNDLTLTAPLNQPYYGSRNQIQAGGTGTFADFITGFWSDVEAFNTGGQSGIAGYTASVEDGTTGTSAGATGFTASVGSTGTGTLGEMVGAHVSVGISGGSPTITKGAGLDVASPAYSTFGIVTHHYGLYIADQTPGTTHNPDPWAIFVAGGVSKFRGVATNLVAKTGAYGVTADDYTVTCDGTFTVTLPITDIKDGQVFVIKNIGTGTITISCANNIDAFNTYVSSTQYEAVTVQWDATATQYWII
jgi:hypothetical protein